LKVDFRERPENRKLAA
jgi:hypothetical protein